MAKTYTYPDDKLPTAENSRFLQLVGDAKDVLEVGCALGFHTRAMRERQSCRIVGIEIDADTAANARPYCDTLLVGDVESMDLCAALGERRFDIVTFGDVLEHLRNPTAALRKVQPFLKPGGYVVASVPNIAHYSIVHELANGRFEYRDRGLLDNTHIHFFTRDTLLKTFEDAGYYIESVDRNRVRPAETEFATPDTPEHRALKAYVTARNPEADTYQFIVKAHPVVDTASGREVMMMATQQIRSLESNVEAARREAAGLRSQLEWMESRPAYRLVEALKRLVSGRSSARRST